MRLQEIFIKRHQPIFSFSTFLFAFALLSCCFPAMGQTEAQAAGSSAAVMPPAIDWKSSVIKDKWGIEIIGIRLTAANHMLDFRYKVIDAIKSAPLLQKKNKPYLMQAATGKVLDVPAPSKVGPLRNSGQPVAGRIYWMLFGNGRNLVKKGDEVAVIIGDFRAANLIVE